MVTFGEFVVQKKENQKFIFPVPFIPTSNIFFSENETQECLRIIDSIRNAWHAVKIIAEENKNQIKEFENAIMKLTNVSETINDQISQKSTRINQVSFSFIVG